jgi:hypothetical protein
MEAPTVNTNDWAKIIADANSRDAENVPEGWLCRSQLEEEWGFSQSHTLKTIQTLCKKGKVVMKKFKVSTTRGIMPIPHYKIK